DGARGGAGGRCTDGIARVAWGGVDAACTGMDRVACGGGGGGTAADRVPCGGVCTIDGIARVTCGGVSGADAVARWTEAGRRETPGIAWVAACLGGGLDLPVRRAGLA